MSRTHEQIWPPLAHKATHSLARSPVPTADPQCQRSLPTPLTDIAIAPSRSSISWRGRCSSPLLLSSTVRELGLARPRGGSDAGAHATWPMCEEDLAGGMGASGCVLVGRRRHGHPGRPAPSRRNRRSWLAM
ncbi:hypothetical protein BDA96_06G239300 [Sorghum bicolor]|uniref:Uncharacterized protein n=2 Tax=Sorghum bicolor TaxID=4558 RepID=A0A921QS94_SORBI|nr:hypothetical protein BDA96_06G239300 [Sorghum bicolor]KXG27136.1 hypothetical protein SORBI_3006G218800 [Sorghum bicolor]